MLVGKASKYNKAIGLRETSPRRQHRSHTAHADQRACSCEGTQEYTLFLRRPLHDWTPFAARVKLHAPLARLPAARAGAGAYNFCRLAIQRIFFISACLSLGLLHFRSTELSVRSPSSTCSRQLSVGKASTIRLSPSMYLSNSGFWAHTCASLHRLNQRALM